MACKRSGVRLPLAPPRSRAHSDRVMTILPGRTARKYSSSCHVRRSPGRRNAPTVGIGHLSVDLHHGTDLAVRFSKARSHDALGGPHSDCHVGYLLSDIVVMATDGLGMPTAPVSKMLRLGVAEV